MANVNKLRYGMKNQTTIVKEAQTPIKLTHLEFKKNPTPNKSSISPRSSTPYYAREKYFYKNSSIETKNDLKRKENKTSLSNITTSPKKKKTKNENDNKSDISIINTKSTTEENIPCTSVKSNSDHNTCETEISTSVSLLLDQDVQCDKLSTCDKEKMLPIVAPLVNAYTKIDDSSHPILKDLISIASTQILEYHNIKKLVQHTIHECKTFSVYLSNGGQDVRKSLIERGWIEKVVINSHTLEIIKTVSSLGNGQLLHHIDNMNDVTAYTRILKSNLLGSNPVDFLWNPPKSASIKGCLKPIAVNHLTRLGCDKDFISKVGLLKYLRHIKNARSFDFESVRFPRAYIISANEMIQFISDFRITGCLSLLKWFVQSVESGIQVISDFGTIPLTTLRYALWQVTKYGEDMNGKMSSSYILRPWEQFLDDYHKCVYFNKHFQTDPKTTENDFYILIKQALAEAQKYRDDLEADGILNVWILKPSNMSQGKGIEMSSDLNNIKTFLEKNNHLNVIVQKYIERPLLIYNTKFDIRQWFLISQTKPLIAWMYKDSYLRFCSREFEPKKLDRSIHLTNYAVQCHYKNSLARDKNLPEDNMWDSNKFQEYLKDHEKTDVWNNIIYPSMKKTLLTLLLTVKDGLERSPHAFELFGVDFMLTSDYKPWIIEINSDPALSHTTSVTKKMCPEVVDDCIKVVIDKKANPLSPTGKFELLYYEGSKIKVNKKSI